MSNRSAEAPLPPGTRVEIRSEEWLVRRCRKASTGGYRLDVTGISELVRGRDAAFLTALDRPKPLLPEETQLVADPSPRYRDTRLFLDCLLRRQPPTDAAIHIGHRAAMDPADYQLQPAAKALTQLRPRVLMADGVGLGKTIEVGVLLSELIQRGRGDRILVVALKSILAQFQLELWARFTIPLVRLDSVGIQRLQARIPSNHNPFQVFDKVIVSIDTLKNDAKYRRYVEQATWDVIVVDECQNVSPRADERSSQLSQRARLAQLLAQKADGLVLTSATPHDGTAKSFAGLMNLLEPTAIADEEQYTAEDVRHLLIRRFKKDVADQVGSAFQERKLDPVRVDASEPENAVFALLKDATFQTIGRTRSTGSAAPAEGAKGRGMLFKTLLLKGFLSSPMACLETVEHRLKHKAVAEADTEAAVHDRNTLRGLAEALRAIQPADFAKYHGLVERLRALGIGKRSDTTRVVVFSERIATLKFLDAHLRQDLGLADDAIGVFHGAMDDQSQYDLVQRFGSEDAKIRVLLASDAAAEGLNLHWFCHRLIHFDLPWSLITLEQRNGRIDRFGQQHQPELSYLLTIPGDTRLRGDLRVLDRLVEKEHQAHTNLGDVAWLMNLHDAGKEEEKIAEGIEEGADPESVIPEDPAADDFFSIFAETADDPNAEPAPALGQRLRLYPDDLAYAKDAFDTVLGPAAADHVDWHDELQGFSLRPPEDLQRRLELLPRELRDDAKDGFDLTTDRQRVMQALQKARSTTGAWPDWQLYWELNPVARWLDDRVLAAFGRHQAPVVQLPQGLAPDERVVILQGLVSNQRGQPVIVDTVGIPFENGTPGTPEPLADLVARTGLDRPLANPGKGLGDTASLEALLAPAVAALEAHLKAIVNDRASRIGEEVRNGVRALTRWKQTRLAQIEATLANPNLNSVQRRRHEERRTRIEAIARERNTWIEEGLRTAPEIAARVLAVLVPAT